MKVLIVWGVKDSAELYSNTSTLRDSLDWALTHILISEEATCRDGLRWLQENFTKITLQEA